ncbi:hypothetical protein [Pseudomonas aeruginosa]|uniref:hypothetical protein n=1 Tax=Pseudomonas aeruginosa TaxID=287 RepID=UPI003D2A0AD1
MSEVKRFDVPSMRSLIQGEQAVMGYEAVLASDYDALAAEAQALREEVAALRARVVVPNRLPRSSDIASIHQHSTGWNACLDELARLNGLTVSEGLLRRLCEPLLSHADYVVARNELRALLSEQEGGKQ